MYENLDRIKGPVSEVILSTISPTHWPDLWRIEIDTYDTPGTIDRIVQVLSAHQITILASEGSVNSLNDVNAMTFLVSAVRYRTKVDQDTKHRRSNPDARLRVLEFMLLLNTLDCVAVDETGAPRIKVRRMETYRALAEQIAEGLRHHGINKPSSSTHGDGTRAGSVFRQNSIFIPKEIASELRDRFGDNAYHTWHVDTKVRLARAHIFSSNRAPGHLQVIFQNNTSYSFSKVVHHIFSIGGNIVKYQMRRGASKGHNGRARLDVTFSGTSNSPLNGVDLERFARERILADSDLTSFGTTISKLSASTQRETRDETHQ